MKINLNQISELIDSLTAIEERHTLEFIAVITGEKDVMRIHINHMNEYDLLIKFCESNFLLIGHSKFKLKVDWVNEIGDTFLKDVPWDDKSTEMFVAYISKSDSLALELALSIELSGEHLDAGKLYGYPDCCCKNYEKISTGEYWIDSLLGNSKGLFFKPWNNKLAYLVHNFALFPDYFPCSLNCDGTEYLSQKYYKLALKNGLKDFANMQKNLMSRTYLVSSDSVISFSLTSVIKNKIILPLDGVTYYGKHVFESIEECEIEIFFESRYDNVFWTWNDITFRVLIFDEKYS